MKVFFIITPLFYFFPIDFDIGKKVHVFFPSVFSFIETKPNRHAKVHYNMTSIETERKATPKHRLSLLKREEEENVHHIG